MWLVNAEQSAGANVHSQKSTSWSKRSVLHAAGILSEANASGKLELWTPLYLQLRTLMQQSGFCDKALQQICLSR